MTRISKSNFNQISDDKIRADIIRRARKELPRLDKEYKEAIDKLHKIATS